MSSQVSTIRGPLSGDALATSRSTPDLRDRVTDAYYGKKGEKFAQLTRARIHWICARVVGKRVLDVGCSQGITAVLLGREGRKVIGIDVSQPCIEEARLHLSREPSWIQANVEFWNGDFLSSGLESQKFDTVVLGEILEHLTQPDSFVDAAAQSLVEGGRVIVTVPFGINDWPDHKQTFYLLEPWRLLSKRFDIEEVKVIGKWIGLTGRLRNEQKAASDDQAFPRPDILAMCEAAFYEIERGATDKNNDLARALKALQSEKESFATETRTLKDRAAHAEAAQVEAERDRDALSQKLSETERSLAAIRADSNATSQQLAEVKAALQSTADEYETKARELREALAQAQDEHETARAELASVRAMVATRDARIAELQASADLLTEALASERRAFAELERSGAVISSRDAQIAELRSQVDGLSEALTNERATRADAAQRLQEAADYAETLSERLIGSLDDQRKYSEEISALRETLDELRARAAAEQAERERLSGDREAVKREAEDLIAQLRTAKQKLELTKTEADAAKQEVDGLRNHYDLAKQRFDVAKRESDNYRKQHGIVKQQLETTKRQLEVAKKELDVAKKSEGADAAQTGNLQSDLAGARNLTLAERSANEQLKRELKNATEHVAKLRAELVISQQQKSAARLDADKAKQTISFQLGYALLHSGRSWRTRVGLPGTVLRLLREGRRREQRQQQKRLAPGKQSNAAERAGPPLPKGSGNSARSSSKALYILDEFSEANWSRIFDLTPINRDTFKKQIADAKVDFALLESCWKGNSGSWQYAFTSAGLAHTNAQALVSALDELKRRKLPIVFWNKEDPMHYDKFLPIAKHCDIILTTDAGRIESYKRDVPTAKVGVLPFGASPEVCNPAGRFSRTPGTICFAGTYFAKSHPERRRQMDAILPAIKELNGVIYDRNSNIGGDTYKFPDVYQPFIRPAIPFTKMADAYKDFKLFLNVNSITESPTMMSRRVYELLASGTPVISTPSRALADQFPDVVQIAETAEDAATIARRLLDNEWDWLRLSHRGYREVLSQHTNAKRSERILELLGRSAAEPIPLVTSITATMRPHLIERIADNLGKQTHPRLEVILVTQNYTASDIARLKQELVRRAPKLERVVVIEDNDDTPLGVRLNRMVTASKGDYIAKMDDDDLYFPNYLRDMLLPFSFADCGIVGKREMFVYLEGSNSTVVRFGGMRHRFTDLVAGATFVIRRSVFETIGFPGTSNGEDSKFLKDAIANKIPIYAADPFNFIVWRSSDSSNHTWKMGDEFYGKYPKIASGIFDAAV